MKSRYIKRRKKFHYIIISVTIIVCLLGQADGATVFAGFYDVAGRMLSAQVLGSAGAISPKAAPGGCTQVRFFAADAGLRPIAEPLTISGS